MTGAKALFCLTEGKEEKGKMEAPPEPGTVGLEGMTVGRHAKGNTAVNKAIHNTA